MKSYMILVEIDNLCCELGRVCIKHLYYMLKLLVQCAYNVICTPSVRLNAWMGNIINLDELWSLVLHVENYGIGLLHKKCYRMHTICECKSYVSVWLNVYNVVRIVDYDVMGICW